MTLEIMSGIMLLLSSLNINSATADKVQEPLMTVADNPITLEEYVRDYFIETPILAEVAKCESQFRQYGANGVFRGNYDWNDVGVMQINERYHAERADDNGFDIKTLEGNLGYAKWLYEREGLTPWRSSKACWKYAEAIALK
jgi:hypothetical protein